MAATIEILETSKQLTAKERVSLRNLADAVKLDEAISEGGEDVIINPAWYAHIAVTPEGLDTYHKYVIRDADGTTYTTGSESFWSSFVPICEEMSAEDTGEPWAVRAFKAPSKNRQGKYFISCDVI